MTLHIRSLVAGLALASAVALVPMTAQASGTEHKPTPERLDWTFAGPFGTYDQAQLQRGFQVYREICSSCHGLTRIAFRNLMQEGGPMFSEAEVRAIAADYTVAGDLDENGQPTERPGRLSDHFPAPFPNPTAAAAALGAAPPDFSLLAKARAAHIGFPGFVYDIFTQYQESGPDYIVALLTGYEEAPHGEEGSVGTYYNPTFLAANWIAMAPPIDDGFVAYGDGTPETLENYARDVAAFMMWAAEPHLNQRKEMGFKVMAFLLIFGSLVYFTKRKVWDAIEH